MRVLVVEDEIRLGSYLKRGLEGEAHAVDLAADGERGLWLARNQPYDVIVLDIMLPKLNGYRLCEQLREDEIWTPVLMLTAKDGEYDIAEALDTGADDYMVKPFSFVELVARLRALARRGSDARPSVLEVGDLKLDPAQHRFWRAGNEIGLTPKEFALMGFLMRRAGQAVSKLDILNNVWDWAFDGDPNIVEVYIGYLRRKIDDGFDAKAIETVRGVGYRLGDAS